MPCGHSLSAYTNTISMEGWFLFHSSKLGKASVRACETAKITRSQGSPIIVSPFSEM